MKLRIGQLYSQAEFTYPNGKHTYYVTYKDKAQALVFYKKKEDLGNYRIEYSPPYDTQVIKTKGGYIID